MKKHLFNMSLIAAALIVTCAAIGFGAFFRGGLEVTPGQISQVRVSATRDVENTVATERNRAEAAARALEARPVFVIDPSINERIFRNLSDFFDELFTIRYNYENWHTQQAAFAEQYRQWQELVASIEMGEADAAENDEHGENPPTPPALPEPPEEPAHFDPDEHFAELPVSLSPAHRQYLLEIDPAEYEHMYESIARAITEVLEPPGISEITVVTLLTLERGINNLISSETSQTIAFQLAGHFLEPNEVIDEEATTASRQSIAENYETVMLLQHQTIVDVGERIDEEHIAIMEALGLLESDWRAEAVTMVGILIIVVLTMLACCWFISYFRRRTIAHSKEALLLFTLYMILVLCLWALSGVEYYFMPILLFAMLTAMLVDVRTAVALNMGMTLIGYFLVGGNTSYLLFFMLAGSLICLLARHTTERNKIVAVALMAAFFNFMLSLALSLAFERVEIPWQGILTIATYAALNGILTVIIAVGSLPLWELIFGVVTPIKLLDLTNPTNPLMRRLTIEAPGTYHHCLIVANLAESAAYDIGANPHIARAGGYYHDIGKLQHPRYFVENITGENPHDYLDPITSAKMIKSHVSHGLTLAAEYRLPQFIKDIIYEHHGTSVVKYFYSKAKIAEDTKVNEEDFRYSNAVPQSKESAVVMLADTVEAAVRSMVNQFKDETEMQAFINKLIKEKLMNGYLVDSELSIKDVDTVAHSFFRVLKGMYHERIPYPKSDEPVEA